MIVHFLGSGDKAGIPRIGCNCAICREATDQGKPYARTRSSVIVQSGSTSLLIDVTPDFRVQMLEANEPIDVVFITHVHWDHCGGLAELRYMEREPKVMTASLEVIKFAEGLMESRSTKSPPPIVQISEYQSTNIGDIKLTPVQLDHSVQTFGCLLENGDSRVSYLLDSTSMMLKRTLETCLRSNLVIVDATSFDQRESGHMSLLEAIGFARRVEADKCVISHIGHQSLSHFKLNEYVKRKYKNVLVAYDGLKIEV